MDSGVSCARDCFPSSPVARKGTPVISLSLHRGHLNKLAAEWSKSKFLDSQLSISTSWVEFLTFPVQSGCISV